MIGSAIFIAMLLGLTIYITLDATGCEPWWNLKQNIKRWLGL